MDACSDTLRQQHLQEVLVHLKHAHSNLKLKRRAQPPPAAKAAGPFPLQLTVSIAAPAAASRYDVESLGLALEVNSSILASPIPGGEAAVSIKVTNPELPQKLKSVIAQQLHAAWYAAAAAAGEAAGGPATGSASSDPFGLTAVLRYAHQHFVQLISACPECIEAYEGVDSQGATQRRFALVSTADTGVDGADDSAPAAAAVSTAPTPPAVVPATAVQAAAAAAPGAVAGTEAAQDAAGVQTASAAPTAPPVARAPSEAAKPAADASTHAHSSSSSSSNGQPSSHAPGLHGSQSAAQQPGSVGAAPDSQCTSCSSQTTSASRDAGSLTGGAAAAAAAGEPPRMLSPAAAPFQPARAGRFGAATGSVPQPATSTRNVQSPVLARQQQHQHQHQQRRGQPQRQQGQPQQQQHSSGSCQQQHPSQQQQHPQQAIAAATAALQQLQLPATAQHPQLHPHSTGADAGSMHDTPNSGSSRGSTARGRGRGRVLGRGRGFAGQGPPGFRGPVAGPAGFSSAAAEGPRAAAAELAARDLQAAQRRYGRSFRLMHPQQLEQQQQHEGLEGQQQQQQQQQQPAQALPEQQQPPPQQQPQQQSLVVPLQPQAFSIMLRPTDPLWGATRGALHVTGTLNPTQYPAAGSLALSLNPSRGVAAAETWVLQEALDRELQQQAGRVWQLRTVMRWLENYAGSELDRCFKAQQELFAGAAAAAGGDAWGAAQQQQQQQQRQQPVLGGRQQRRSGTAGAPAGAGPSTGAVSARSAANAGSAAAGAGQGIKIIRAKTQGTGQQQGQVQGGQLASRHQQQEGQQQQGQHGTSTSSSSGSDDGSSSDAGSSASGSSSGGGSSAEPGSDGSSGGSSDGDASDTGSEGSAEGVSPDEVQLHGEAAGGSGGPGGWAITLEGLKLDNVGVLEVVQAAVQLSCIRCSSSTTVLLTASGGSRIASASTAAAAAEAAATPAPAAAAAGPPGSSNSPAIAPPSATGSRSSSSSSSGSRAFEWSGDCSTCQQALSVLLRPRFVHAASNVLAGVKAGGCRPLDLLPSVYGATCTDCDAVGALRGLQVGVPANRSCGHCHRTLGVSIPAVSFIPQGPPAGGKQAAGGPSLRRSKAAGGGGGGRGGVGLVEGSPLPDNGACKHYRHSYRWLRFPCCGARYACDLCHEEATADGHDAAWASRMVCGFCSREQPVAPACKYCAKKLATSASKPSGRNTRHWEGGSGCRDVKMLDRRDAAKYRNSKGKTKSAKATRVGPKPWSGGAGGARSS